MMTFISSLVIYEEALDFQYLTLLKYLKKSPLNTILVLKNVRNTM